MITSLGIHNFKCFRELHLETGPLTLLSGLNGMGKSSVIQTLLLLRQSYQQNVLKEKGIHLMGDLTRIGTARDALFEDAREEIIRFDLSLENNIQATWELLCKDTRSSLLELMNSSFINDSIFQCPLFTNHFHYIEAERIGPRTSYDLIDVIVRQHRQLGKRGEFTTYFLSIFGKEHIKIGHLAHPRAQSMSLRSQTEAWLSEFCNSTIRIHTNEHPGMDLVNLGYSFTREKQAPGREYRATNVGFGITFILPILVAILSSDKNTLLLLENPEAHLHPKGQVIMGKLIAKAAEAGLQIIVETHSDHILNGIRIAACKGDVAPEKVKLHFFERDEVNSCAQVISPHVDKNGRLDYWPSGFFDEWERALEDLI